MHTCHMVGVGKDTRSQFASLSVCRPAQPERSLAHGWSSCTIVLRCSELRYHWLCLLSEESLMRGGHQQIITYFLVVVCLSNL